jgi:hypothetical protein
MLFSVVLWPILKRTEFYVKTQHVFYRFVCLHSVTYFIIVLAFKTFHVVIIIVID